MPSPPQNITPDLETVRAKYGLPALAAVVLYRGEITAQGAAGVRKMGDPTPVTPTDAFHMGSCTKAMTATLCARLIERNLLRWDSTLGDIFQKVASEMRPEWKPVTLLQLVHQRSGLTSRNAPRNSDLNAMHRLPGSPRQIREQFARLMLAEPPENKPGTTFLYSNVNYALAGLMAETVTNTPWETLMEREIFAPLGMRTAGFGSMGTPALPPDAPWQHNWRDNKNNPLTPGPHSDNPQTVAPAGLVHCSLQDWAAFVRDHLKGERGENPILLKPATYRFLHTPPAEGGDYAAGWIIANRSWGGNKPIWNHAGSNTMNFCIVWAGPAPDFAVLIATNTGAPDAAKACEEIAGPMIRRTL